MKYQHSNLASHLHSQFLGDSSTHAVAKFAHKLIEAAEELLQQTEPENPPDIIQVESKEPPEINGVSVEEWFHYHPPTANARAKYAAVNAAAEHLATTIIESVDDAQMRKAAFYKLLEVKMLANQGITIDDIRGNESNESQS